MDTFYATFGMMYAYEPHPTWRGAHPDTLLEVHAKNYEDAREQVYNFVGRHFAFLYTASEMRPETFLNSTIINIEDAKKEAHR